jgi:hypothetical protein
MKEEMQTPSTSEGELGGSHLTFDLHKNKMGKWTLRLQSGSDTEVIVVRAFPIEAPETGISILSTDGKELVWIEKLESLNDAQSVSVLEALREREFMPEILKLDRVSAFTTPCVWYVHTSRGPTELELKGEEDIRRLSSKTLLISDTYGVQFVIKDLPKLDRHSKKLLDRFF